METKVFPSILAADLGRLAAECKRAEHAGADGLHLDIMDGQFVNNISMGFEVIRQARSWVDIPLSVHLMIVRPDLFIERCAEFGAETIMIHQEAPCDIPATLKRLRELGVRAGITLNPDTPVETITDRLEWIDEVLVMSVFPGFGGQSFISDVLQKISALREMKPDLDISIDGGINQETAEQAARAGANIFGVGSFLFRSEDMAADIKQMHERTFAAFPHR